MNRRVHHGGFTLMEIVVVITILAILAAFAVPRLASFEGQGRVAAAHALAGSIRSGASLAHTLWLVQGNPSSTSVVMDGQTITMTYGYPDDAAIDNTLVEYTGFSPTASGGSAIFTKQTPAGADIPNCFVTYTPPAAANEAPTIVSTTSGC